jgi:molybdate transport system substrate-binding protein
VFAAASLREAFTALGADFELAHAGVKPTFNFAGTQELRTQLEQGAAADVFASADQRHMLELVAAGRVIAPATFARNEPVVVVAREQLEKLRTFSDLPKAQRIVIGAPEVPIGRYTVEILEHAAKLGDGFREKVEANVVSRELNVKQVLAKVTLGEADAGIVYRTDAKATKEPIGIIVIPPELNVIAEYPIAAVAAAPHPKLARAWIELVRGPAGRAALTAAGFMPPSDDR